MELDAIKNSWKQENLQIAANVQLNKSALMEKINKETSWMKGVMEEANREFFRSTAEASEVKAG